MSKTVQVVERFSTDDMMLEIAAGNVPDHRGVNKFGRNADIDAEVTETVWTGGGIWARPTQPRVHQIVSTDVNDTLAGSGAQRIVIQGLTSWSKPEVTEIIEMDGTTNVPTSQPYVIIHRMRVIQGASNVGAITAIADTDATLTAEIPAGEGQTGMAIYGVPIGQSAFITNWWCSIRRQSNSAFDANLVFTDRLGIVTLRHYVGGHSQGSTTARHFFQPYSRVLGPAIISVEATPTTANTELTAGFDLILQEKPNA